MALRSVLNIDVQDAALDRLQQKLEKYHQTARNLPAISATGRVTGPGAQRGGITPEERAVPFAERLARAWGTMREHSREVVRNVREMGQRMLSMTGWMSALTGLATLGGGLGFNALAGAAGNMRQRAIGAGTTIGGFQAAQTELGRFADVGSLLPQLKNAVQTPGSPGWTALQMLGVRPQAGEDSADVLERLLPAIRDRMQRTPEATRGMMWRALGGEALMPFEQTRQITDRPPGELEGQIARTRQMRGRMNVSDDQARAYQDFTTRLREAGGIIETTLINRLAALAGPLGQLSERVTSLLQSFIKWALSEQNIDKLSDAIKRFADWLGTHDFEADWKRFTSAISDAVSAVEGFVATLKRWFGGAAGDQKELPPVTLEEQQGTKPSVGGTGFDWNTWRFRHFEGTEDEQLKQRENAPLDPIYRRKQLYQPSAFQFQGGQGMPIMATRAIPVEIVGFRGVGEKKDTEQQQPQSPWQGMVQQASFRPFGNDNGIPDDFLSRIERVESGGRLDAVSSAGAMGPMQFMPQTWKRFGAGGNPFNEQDAMAAAARYLQYMTTLPEIGNDPARLAAGYNAGEGAVSNAVRKFGQEWLSHLPRETQDYVPKVLGQSPQTRAPFHPPMREQSAFVLQNEAGGNLVVTTRKLAV